MNRLPAISFGFVLLLVAGCGGNSSTGGSPDEPAVGLLSPVADAAEFEASIKAGLTAMSSNEQLTLAADIASGAATDNFTGTYTQEKNVDEFDAVRYDGSHLFVAPRRYYYCCYLLDNAAADGATNTGTEPQRSIRILSTDADNAEATLAGTIPLEDNVSVQGMYLDGGRMFALTGESFYGGWGELWADIAIWEAPEQLGYRIYDVTDATSPVLEIDAKIDGVFIDSRRIGNTVYIVSRYTPHVDGLHYYVSTPEEQAQNEQILAGVSLGDLLPKITINGTTRNLLAPDHCYATTDDAAGYPVLTSITAVPIDNPTEFSTTCYNESAYGVYVSEDALYFTEFRPDISVSRSTTRIHKFALSGTQVAYRGSADIDGTVWRGGQADFRMSEHAGDLRILASQFDWTNVDFVDHNLFILRESTTRPELDIVSTLPNEQRPDEIGKPNEALYGVRFLADRAYAVTFEQIDPLYAIDLSNPLDPFIAGELEITGFSDFLHPINDDLLLGLGTGASGGIKIELFDVSDMSQPLSRGSTTLGGRGSYSEAIYDRHAFSYQVNSNGVDRFTIPATLYSFDGSYNFLQSGLYLFEIHDKDMPSLAWLSSAGSIIPPANGTTIPYYADRNRSFIHNDTVYYVRDEAVWAAFWQSPMIVNGPF